MKPWMSLMAILLMAVVLLVGCGGGGSGSGSNPVAQTSEGVVVQGKITGEGDMAGIPVYLLGIEARVPPTTSLRASTTEAAVGGQLYFSITDASGVFTFQNVTPGMYNLVAKKDRYLGSIRRNLFVTPAASIMPTDLQLLLSATGDVSGQVQVPADYTSRSGIIAFLPGTSFSAYTDSNGRFTITGVPVGSYTVSFTAPGLAQARLDNISISAGLTTSLPQVTLAQDTSSFGGIDWKGDLAAAPASPQKNWAYYDTVLKRSLIWDGDSWEILSLDGLIGQQGPAGPQGPQGPAGVSIAWQGSFPTAPANPQLNWGYLNTTNGGSYIWDGDSWEMFARSDIFPPIISNVSIKIGTGDAISFGGGNVISLSSPDAISFSSADVITVSCDTDEDSIPRVDYGPATYTTYSNSDVFSKHHSLSINSADFWSDPSFHFRISAKDVVGNEAITGDHIVNKPTIPLNISEITTEYLSETAIRISWTTDKLGISRVEYGTTTSYGNSTSYPSPEIYSANHSVIIQNLIPNTTYHLRVYMKTSSGNETISEDRVFVFDPIGISGISAEFVSVSAIKFSWTTNLDCISRIDYGLSPNYENSTNYPTPGVFTKNHSITVNNLTTGTLYHFLIRSKTAAGTEATKMYYRHDVPLGNLDRWSVTMILTAGQSINLIPLIPAGYFGSVASSDTPFNHGTLVSYTTNSICSATALQNMILTLDAYH